MGQRGQRFAHGGMEVTHSHSLLVFLLLCASLAFSFLPHSLLLTFFLSFYLPFPPLLLTHTCTQPHLYNTFPLNHTAHRNAQHTHAHTRTDTVQSSTPHAARNFLKAMNPGVKKYSISTAPCCVPSPGPGSAMPYHNQFHKLNWGVRCCMKVRQPTLTAIWAWSTYPPHHVQASCQAKP